MMTATDVLEALECLEGSGVPVWLDGGWGVDALLGHQTRPHDDLDIVIDLLDLSRARAALEPLGFRHAAEVQPGLPARLVLRDPVERQIDFHPILFDEAGDGWQELGGGSWGHYPVSGLTGTGSIAGRAVRCVTPELQIQHHLGYEPDVRDRHDVRLLAESFHLALPARYENPSD